MDLPVKELLVHLCGRMPTLTPKPYKSIGFVDIYAPKPYKFIGFGDIYAPKPYKFLGFGDKVRVLRCLPVDMATGR